MCKYSSVQEGDCDSRRGAQKLGISVEELKKTWQRQAAARTRLNKIRSRNTSGNLISRRFFHMVLRFCCGSCGIVEQIKIM